MKIAASPKHVTHVDHLVSVPTGKVERAQPSTPPEHRIHVDDVGSVEIVGVGSIIFILGIRRSEIQSCQTGTLIEHHTHVRDLRGIQQMEIHNGGQMAPKCKPHVSRSRLDFIMEIDLGDIVRVVGGLYPTWLDISPINIKRRTSIAAFRTFVVVVEMECSRIIVCKVGVGLLRRCVLHPKQGTHEQT